MLNISDRSKPVFVALSGNNPCSRLDVDSEDVNVNLSVEGSYFVPSFFRSRGVRFLGERSEGGGY